MTKERVRIRHKKGPVDSLGKTVYCKLYFFTYLKSTVYWSIITYARGWLSQAERWSRIALVYSWVLSVTALRNNNLVMKSFFFCDNFYTKKKIYYLPRLIQNWLSAVLNSAESQIIGYTYIHICANSPKSAKSFFCE